MNKKENIVWIGLAKIIVLKQSRILNGAKYAYANVLGLAKNKSAFMNEVACKFTFYGSKLIRLEETEPFMDRKNKFHVSLEILEISKCLSADLNKIEFSTFHAYTKD